MKRIGDWQKEGIMKILNKKAICDGGDKRADFRDFQLKM